MTSTTARTVLGTCAAVGLTLTLSGCSLFGGSSTSASGVSTGAPSLPAGARVAASGTAGATATPTGSVAPAQASLRPKPGAGKAPCSAPDVLTHLSKASGAVHTYLAKPGTPAPTVIALKSASSKALGAKAAGYAANELIAAVTSASGCATTSSLSSVTRQTSSYLVKLATALSGNAATDKTVAGAATLMSDVRAQAGLAGLTVVDTPPTLAQLK